METDTSTKLHFLQATTLYKLLYSNDNLIENIYISYLEDFDSRGHVMLPLVKE
jgi:hypothetical protein